MTEEQKERRRFTARERYKTGEKKERARLRRQRVEVRDAERAKNRAWRLANIIEQRERERVKAAARYVVRQKVQAENRKRLKEECILYKGGECSECGFAGHHAALDFHHIDRSLKAARKGKELGTIIGDLSTRVDQSIVFDKMIPELDATVLLCSNCHRIHHWEEQHPKQ